VRKVEDRQIVILYLNRSESAILETKTKYGQYILKIAMNILGNVSDSSECENDTYLSTWNSIPPKEPENLKSYVGKISRNLALDLYRKKHAEKRGGNTDVLLSELEDCVPDKTENFSDVNLTELLNSFLKDQNKDKRVMFVKRYWYGESISDIAKEMGFSESKVATTLHRTRESLKEYLEKEGVSV